MLEDGTVVAIDVTVISSEDFYMLGHIREDPDKIMP